MYAILWAMGLSSVAATTLPQDIVVRTRNAPGMSDIDTFRAIRRALSAAEVHKRDLTEFKNSTSLDTSWDGAVLFSLYVYILIVTEDVA